MRWIKKQPLDAMNKKEWKRTRKGFQVLKKPRKKPRKSFTMNVTSYILPSRTRLGSSQFAVMHLNIKLHGQLKFWVQNCLRKRSENARKMCSPTQKLYIDISTTPNFLLTSQWILIFAMFCRTAHMTWVISYAILTASHIQIFARQFVL